MEVLAVVNGVLTVLGSLSVVVVPWLARRLGDRTQQFRDAEEAAGKIAEGLKYIESAVAANKPDSGPGAAITQTIQQYGPSAIAAVDTARNLAHQIAEEAWKAQEEQIIARERENHAKDVAAQAAQEQAPQ
jgi:biopolymer transport protein ExbB/TolQ